MAKRVLLILILSQVVLGMGSENYRKDDLIGRISNGMKFATDILGSESVAQKVAEFVVRAFQTANRPRRPSPTSDFSSEETANKSPYKRPSDNAFEDVSEENLAQENRPDFNVDSAPSPLSPLKYLVRLFGLQPSQISAVAVNALVFVAQMISTFLAGNKKPSRLFRSEDPNEWILNKRSSKLQELISKAKNESLLDDIEGSIKSQEDAEETSCIRLLVCKITPFVHKMQEAVFGNERDNVERKKKLRGAAIMYRHLPSADEINARSDICEQKHPDCDLKH